jgi:transposase, IS5 family
MTQMGFSAMEFATKKKRTRRERFLEQIEAATPWALLVGLIEPHYPKGARGRPPIGLERMLRMYIVQQCFGLADEATEDALYDSQSIRAFVGVDLSREDAAGYTGLEKRDPVSGTWQGQCDPSLLASGSTKPPKGLPEQKEVSGHQEVT